MPRRETSIDYQIVQISPANIGRAGLRLNLWDRVSGREQSISAIPGSTIKGCLRGTAGQLARSLGLSVCDRPATCRLGASCVTCTIFGNSRNEASLAWSDATIHPEVAGLLSSTSLGETRSRMPIDRVTGTGIQGAVAMIEATPEGMIYLGSARGWVLDEPSDPDRSMMPAPVLLVLAAMRLTSNLGSGRSTGLGACRFDVATVRWGDERLSAGRALAQVDRLGSVEVA